LRDVKHLLGPPSSLAPSANILMSVTRFDFFQAYVI
jgi:hypothetical protein